LKNNVIVLSLPFAHHTELQNFLIASRILRLFPLIVVIERSSCLSVIAARSEFLFALEALLYKYDNA